MTDLTNEPPLLSLLHDKRQSLERYVARAAPQRRSLLNVTIIAGALATFLTAAPALGGKSFVDLLKAGAGLNFPAWQLLCATAALCSALATVANQVLKSGNLDERLVQARASRARLEALELGLAAGSLDVTQATPEYLRCLEEMAQLDLA